MSLGDGLIGSAEVAVQRPIANVVGSLEAVFTSPQDWYVGWGKRTLDVGIVVLLSPLWVPIYVAIATILLLSHGRPIHYRSDRPGRNCVPFSFIKFRSMRDGAQQDLPSLLEADPALAAEFEQYHKLRNDPRCTRVGALLRRTSLDELPQLFCVLRGDMSLVGPRPPWRAEEYETFYGDNAAHIFRHRPGLTGLWQVSRRTPAPYERKVWLDMIYASRCSLTLDLKILARTVPSVLRGHGAF